MLKNNFFNQSHTILATLVAILLFFSLHGVSSEKTSKNVKIELPQQLLLENAQSDYTIIFTHPTKHPKIKHVQPEKLPDTLKLDDELPQNQDMPLEGVDVDSIKMLTPSASNEIMVREQLRDHNTQTVEEDNKSKLNDSKLDIEPTSGFTADSPRRSNCPLFHFRLNQWWMRAPCRFCRKYINCRQCVKSPSNCCVKPTTPEWIQNTAARRICRRRNRNQERQHWREAETLPASSMVEPVVETEKIMPTNSPRLSTTIVSV